jgi:hypothetical protein
MEISRDHVLAVMRRVGLQDQISRAVAELPDPIDPDRDAQILGNLGLSRERLMQLLGSRP